ncbi:Flocculation suppression protein [Coemansia erecta]|nr:Flocculation suppression protein [Coemansia erecta]
MAASPTSPSTEHPADTGPASPVSAESTQKSHLRIQRTHAAFVSKLYAMVCDSDTDTLISWTAEGDCFKVTDPAEFSRVVLPLYFKHNNWQSFVRQLNMYGFHKISDLAYGGVFGDMQLWMFKHAYFQRDQVRLLQNIKRRGSKPMPSSALAAELSDTEAPITPASAPPGPEPATPAQQAADPGAETRSTYSDSASLLPCQHADGYIDELKECIADLRHSSSQLQRENQEMRAAISNCQGAFAGIMRFLESTVVQPPRHAVASEGTITDAFRRLTSDIAPIFSLGSGPLQVPVASPELSDAPSLSPRFFRPDNSGQQPEYYRHGPTLPPMRLGSSPQSSILSRIPSLSPPTLAVSSADPECAVHGTTACYPHTRKRCSSSSSAGSISEADESQSPRPQLFLPPISGLVKDITYDHQSEPSLLKEPRNWYPPCQTSLPSSLRETLPAKRSKTEHCHN